VRYGVVYLITNTVNGKKYVGQTIAPLQQRWRQHVHKARNGSRLAIHCAIRKYGRDKFTIICLEVVDGSRDDLIAAEIHHIASQGALAPFGYNLSEGGEGFDASQPELKKRHLAAIRKSASSPTWRQAQFTGAQKRLADPEWRANNAFALQVMHSSFKWRKRHEEVLRQLHSDPEMRAKYDAGIKRRSENVVWREQNAVILAQARAKRTADAVARDALCSPEEARRRARRRLAGAHHRAKMAARVSSCTDAPVDEDAP